jgi:hypothetical protein
MKQIWLVSLIDDGYAELQPKRLRLGGQDPTRLDLQQFATPWLPSRILWLGYK